MVRVKKRMAKVCHITPKNNFILTSFALQLIFERLRRSGRGRSHVILSDMWRTQAPGWSRPTASSSSTAPNFVSKRSVLQVTRTHTRARTLVLQDTHFHPSCHSVAVFCLPATSDEEMVMWVKGLTWLVSDTLRSPTPLQIER